MKAKDWLAFTALGIIWGSSFLWIKIAIQEVGPFLLVSLRVLVGALGLLGVYLLRRPELPTKRSTWLTLIVVGVTNTAAPFVLISWGELYIDSGVAAILNASVPLFTTILAHFMLSDDKINWQRVVGLPLGFIGIIMIVIRDNALGEQSRLMGEVAVLAAAVLYAISAILIRRTTEQIDPVVRSLVPLAAADGLLWIVTPLAESPVNLPQQINTWLAILWLGVLGTFLAYLIYFYLVHSVGPTRATMVTYTFPVVGVVLGVIFLHEVLDLNIVLGGSLVLGSIILVNR
jgi:drug/metabolite transporter (DMT)-like permease